MRLGATGHCHVPPAALTAWSDALERLARGPEALVRAVCCGAEGADQAFGAAMLRLGVPLELVIPCAGYEAALGSVEARETLRRLCDAAAAITTLPYPRPSEEAYLAAGLVMVERCDHLVALWDGRPARGLGGTGDVVAHAEAHGRGITVVWPPGLVRP